MKLPPILYHYFRKPLPYTDALALQEKLHLIQLVQRQISAHKDILLLLEHRPVYTSGRRQTETTVQHERTRLTKIGADFVTATRGGQLTYHGPGQIVGYPLLDLARYRPTMGARDYVCRMQKFLQLHLKDAHGIQHTDSEHTGVFLDPTTKIASIGVQVRHRLTSHGFALNITKEPIAWFDKIVACGLDDVRAGCMETALKREVNVTDEIPSLVQKFGQLYERDMEEMIPKNEGLMGKAILEMEEEAEQAGDWIKAPLE